MRRAQHRLSLPPLSGGDKIDLHPCAQHMCGTCRVAFMHSFIACIVPSVEPLQGIFCIKHASFMFTFPGIIQRTAVDVLLQRVLKSFNVLKLDII